MKLFSNRNVELYTESDGEFVDYSAALNEMLELLRVDGVLTEYDTVNGNITLKSDTLYLTDDALIRRLMSLKMHPTAFEAITGFSHVDYFDSPETKKIAIDENLKDSLFLREFYFCEVSEAQLMNEAAAYGVEVPEGCEIDAYIDAYNELKTDIDSDFLLDILETESGYIAVGCNAF